MHEPIEPGEDLVGTSFGPYRIEEKLGQGGMGVVYKALDVNLQRPVALKMIKGDKASATEGGQARFMGSLNSTASTSYRIEFFANTSGDASGYGEGQRYLGFADVTTDGSGNATIDVTCAQQSLLSISVTRHKYWTATIDGKPAQLLPANIAYQGIVVTPGRHRVTMVYRNTVAVPQPKSPEQGYHFMTDMTDEAITWTRNTRAADKDKPWFVYFSTGAAHAPHHAGPAQAPHQATWITASPVSGVFRRPCPPG